MGRARGRRRTWLGLAGALLAVSSQSARADGPAPDASATAAAVDTTRRHAAFVELLGKGGLWGIGYDYAVAPRVAMGGAASFYVHDGESVLTLSPYAAIYPVGNDRHRGFLQLGPQIVRLDRMSPVPEWDGQHTTGLGVEACAGYELRTRVIFRAFAMGSAGKRGLVPWIGVTFGVTL